MRGRTGEKPGICARAAALLLTALLLAPGGASGELGDFVPTINYTSGDLELTSMRQNEENTAGGRGTKTSDDFLSGRLVLYLDGFVYHPRFVQFLVKDAAGAYRERYEGNFGGSYDDTALSNDYEMRTKILPEHPYNVELFALSMTPYFRQNVASTRVTDVERGAIFNYADRPVFLNVSHTTGESRSRIYSSEYRSERASGSHLLGPMTNSAAYTHTDSSTSLGLHSVNEESSFGNTIAVSNVSLDSRYTRNNIKQHSPFAAALDTDNRSWLEQLNAQLPWNFSTSAVYNALKTVLTTEAGETTPKQEAITEIKSTGFSLTHKLYDSVRTSYFFSRILTDSTSGETESVMHSVNGIYTKRIPTNGRLTISGQGSSSSIDQESAPLVVGEIYSAALFGNFTLSRERIDPDTIALLILTGAGASVEMTRNVHYVVEEAGAAFKVSIIALPPELIAEAHPLGHAYTFRVSYNLLAGELRLVTTTIGYGVNLALFDGFLTPYYSRLRTEQELRAGSIPGGPQETDTDVTGIIIRKAPLSWLTEERTVDSEASPSRSLRNALEYSNRMSDTLNLTAKAERLDTRYGRGLLGTRGYTERINNLNLTMMKNVPRKNFSASLTAYYSRRSSTFDTELSSASGNVSWKLGLLSVDAGASFNSGETTAATGRQRQRSEFYYLTLKRKLF